MPTTLYFVAIPEHKLRDGHRTWNANDEKGRKTHHGVVRLSESPLDLRLTWTLGAGHQRRLIGCYRLNLQNLLRDGYVREDREPGTVRLRFVREDNGIFVRVREFAPGIRVGTLRD
jgi:hypothetical protein